MTFRDTVVADLLTSLVRVVLDLAFTSLYSLYWYDHPPPPSSTPCMPPTTMASTHPPRCPHC